MLEVAGYLKLD